MLSIMAVIVTLTRIKSFIGVELDDLKGGLATESLKVIFLVW